jgi:hypothetical protein
LRRLARRHQHLTEEITAADAELKGLVSATAPGLLTLVGVGVEVAGQLLISAGDNPQRLRSEAAFAHLCGVAPLPASSGKTHRHRLNCGGDRAANTALYTVALSRLRCDPAHADTLNDESNPDSANLRSSAASSVTSPARSIGTGQLAPFLVVLAASQAGTSGSTLKHRGAGSGHHSPLPRVGLGLVVGAGVTVRAAG